MGHQLLGFYHPHRQTPAARGCPLTTHMQVCLSVSPTPTPLRAQYPLLPTVSTYTQTPSLTQQGQERPKVYISTSMLFQICPAWQTASPTGKAHQFRGSMATPATPPAVFHPHYLTTLALHHHIPRHQIMQPQARICCCTHSHRLVRHQRIQLGCTCLPQMLLMPLVSHTRLHIRCHTSPCIQCMLHMQHKLHMPTLQGCKQMVSRKVLCPCRFHIQHSILTLTSIPNQQH